MLTDRYLPSSLVLQRIDGLTWDAIWQLNTGQTSRALRSSSTPTLRSCASAWSSGADRTVGSSALPTVPLKSMTCIARPLPD